MIRRSLLQKILEKLKTCCSYEMGIVEQSGEWVLTGNDSAYADCLAELSGSISVNNAEAVKDKLYVLEDRVYAYLLDGDSIAAALMVWGPPDEIQNIVPALRMACETMLDAELAADRNSGRSAKFDNNLDFFGHCLLYDNIMPPSRIRLIANNLGYCENILRVAILISLPCLAPPERIRSVITCSKVFRRNSILVNTKEEGLWVLFHAISDSNNANNAIFSDTMLEIREDSEELKRHLKSVFDVQPNIYIGSVQNSISLLRYSYQHAKWLMDQCESESNAVFYDYLHSYIMERVPYGEIYNIMHLFSDMLGDTAAKNTFIRNIEALQQNCYNLSKCSKDLYIHKNTLIIWLKKLNDNIGIDPLHVRNDRELAKYLCYYLKKSLSKVNEW